MGYAAANNKGEIPRGEVVPGGNGGKRSSSNAKEDDGWQRRKALLTELYKPGDGTNDVQKKVKRIMAQDFLTLPAHGIYQCSRLVGLSPSGALGFGIKIGRH